MRQPTHAYRSLVLGIAIVSLGACQPVVKEGQTAALAGPLPVLTFDERTAARQLTCEVSCSQFKLRTGNAQISWSNPAVAGAETRLDFAVHKNGFETGVFASFSPFAQRQELTPATVSSAKMREIPAFNVRMLKADLAKTGETRNSMTVEGLEPGLIYRWRILTRTARGWVPSQTVACPAPVCPADMIKEK